ncbi:T9SS type A sorting domain-containing protein [Taibaiella chishuiensis]|uniref:Putative secreted protein (Por secretion system target) n=1 Tax=Taibaiella chishuiensis TaxID=1434707 RepID=A0A2P8D8G9_9BACT|nr:T9SS type A sorting domain-containing protein [Taibaiella chishuiensis]PSK93461.1 putative secreted protein (Por secretion system target) [Taibaiella chishuiensis]
MYRTQKTLIASLLLTTAAFYTQAQTPCTFQVPTTQSNLQVPSGATWCITADMSANAEIASGGVLRIAKGVTVTLWSLNNFNGTIENYGTLTTGGINAGNSSTTIRNLGTLTINSGINANSGIQLINETNSTFQLNGGANLNAGSVLTNSGVIDINGSLNMNGTVTITNNTDAKITFSNGVNLSGNGSVLTNNGMLTINSGDFNTHSGTTLNNSGRLTIVGGNFNPSSTVTNKGWFDARHFININSGAVITNKCRFVAREGFNNNATFTNDGLVWVSNSGNPKITINGGATFTNTVNGKVRGADFDNNGTVVGSGEFYFTGITRQQGNFNGNDAGNPIKFFAANLAPNANYPNSYFNVGVQGINVMRPASLTPADTNSFYTFCGEQTFTTGGTPLPVTLTGFSAYAENCSVILNWATAEETKFDHFEIEGSANASQFKSLAQVASQGPKGGNYNYTLAQTPDTRYYRLKITDLGNKVTYSKTLNVTNTCTGLETSWKVYPNPASQDNMIQVSDIAVTEGRVVITNLMGVTVKTVPVAAARQGFRISGVYAGTYLVSVYNQDGKRMTSTQKLVIR